MVLPVIAALTPLVIAPAFWFYFDVTPKVVVLLLGVALALIPGVRALPHLWIRRDGIRFAVLLAAQLCCFSLATLFSSNPALSVGGSNWRRLGLITHAGLILFALLAAACLAKAPGRLQSWLRLFCAAGTLASLYGTAQYFGWDPWLAAASYHVGEGESMIVRPPSTLGHASYAATFYLHAVFAGLALFLTEAAGAGWKRLGAATAYLASIALVLSGTRAAILGLLAGLALLGFLIRLRIGRRHLAAAVAIMVAFGAFYVSPWGQKMRGRARWSLEDPLGGPRIQLWRDAARMGADRWVTGWGLEAFSSEFPRYQSRELARAFPDFYHESPHNIFLEAWTEQGLGGLLALAGVCVLGLRAMRRSPASSALGAGLAAAVIAQQFTSFTLATAMCFYFTVAMLVALGPAGGAPGRRQVSPVALVPVMAVLGGYAIALAVTDRMLGVADHQLTAGHLREGSAAYELARKWAPPGVSSDIWYSRKLADTARRSNLVAEGAAALQLSEDAATRATFTAEDRHNAFYNLASIQAARNNAVGVESNLRKAIAVAPNWFKPHWTLAQLLALSGRASKELARTTEPGAGRDPEFPPGVERRAGPVRAGEAEAEAALAGDLDGGKHPEVADTLRKIRSQK